MSSNIPKKRILWPWEHGSKTRMEPFENDKVDLSFGTLLSETIPVPIIIVKQTGLAMSRRIGGNLGDSPNPITFVKTI